MSALFKIHRTARLPSRSLFAFAGELMEGELRAGMSVTLELNSSLSLTIVIDRVEDMHMDHRALIGLLVRIQDPAECEIYEALDLVGECLAARDVDCGA